MFKKLFIKAFLLIAATQLTIYLYVRYFPTYYNSDNNHRWWFLKHQFETPNVTPCAKVLFLGESRLNAGVDFTQFPNSWSYASGGSTAIEMYYALKKHLNIHPKPDTVFLSVSPRFLSELFAFWPYAVRNDFFSWHEFKNIFKNNTRLNDTLLKSTAVFDFVLYKANYFVYYQNDLKNNKLVLAKKRNDYSTAQMQQLRGAREHPGLQDSCNGVNYETGYQTFQPSALIWYYFQQIFDDCRQYKIHLIFESMPMNQASALKLNPKFVSDFADSMQLLQKKYPEFTISDSLYFYSNQHFGDPSHLNRLGKRKLTKEITEKYFSNK